MSFDKARVLAGVCWFFLLLATGVTWLSGEAGHISSKLVVLLLTLTFLKGSVIALNFMHLSEAPRLWRYAVMGWLSVTCMVVYIAYSLGVNA